MREFGAFNDEGCTFAGFSTLASAAEEAAYQMEDGDEWAYAAELCPDHEEQARDACEECLAEDETDDEDEEV
jgi:hypothetical protein